MRTILFYHIIFLVLIFKAQNNFRIYSANGELFKLDVNNVLVNNSLQASVLVKNLTVDTLNVNIEFENKVKVESKIYLLEKSKTVTNKEFTYKVENIKNKLEISFVNVLEIQKLIEPIVPLKPLIDTSYKYNNNVLGHFCELKNSKPTYFNNTPKQGNCEVAMPPEYLNYVAILMLKTEVADDKFEVVENVFRNNCVSTVQTNSLLKYIDYEVEKLKLIKIAYFNIIDKANLKNLESSFKFESSKKELQNYLSEVKNAKQLTNINCTKASEDNEIKSFIDKLTTLTSDNERYEIFKKLYTNYCYSSTQVKLLLQPFIHDREKFDAAKLLYYYCMDKTNYLLVSDVFSYKQTEGDLKDFIEKQN